MNELRNDPDPEGWQLYLDVIANPAHYVQYAEDVSSCNRESAEVQVKCLDYFIDIGNVALALRAAAAIAKDHAKYPKATRSMGKFNAFLADADKSKLSAEDQALLADFQGTLLPAFEQGKVTKAEAAKSMEHALEFLKLKPKDDGM